MTALILAGLLALGSPPPAAPRGAPERARDEGVEYAQLSFHSRMVVRVERMPVTPPLARFFREKKGPHCIKMEDIVGSAVLLPNTVDIVLRGGDRVRAKFEASCPGLDYYRGFYVLPNSDAKICAGRDVVRDRAGGECSIDKFRKLVRAK